MKSILLPVFLLSFSVLAAQDKGVQKLWETDSIVAVPESVLPFKNNLYVSLIDGGPWDADGKGGVGVLSADGKNYNGSWITGLNAPKGLGKYNNLLYAADISEVVVIDISKAAVIKKIAIEGASGLNDITVNDAGAVYVSDSKTSRIWKIENGNPVLFLENVAGANGVKAIGNRLVYAQGKQLMSVGVDKKPVKIAEVTEGIDGIEPVGNGDFLVSSWVGYLYYVHPDGTFQTLLDTHEQKKNIADIGYDPAKKIIYIPGFFTKTVAAYQLK
jgi:hypothetical protein